MKNYNITNYDIVFNKIDLKGLEPRVIRNSPTEIYLSAINNIGINLIRDRVDEDFIKVEKAEDLYLARSRHVDHLLDAKEWEGASLRNQYRNHYTRCICVAVLLRKTRSCLTVYNARATTSPCQNKLIPTSGSDLSKELGQI